MAMVISRRNRCGAGVGGVLIYSRILFNRSALPITDTELKLMAAAAIIGESSMPKKGYNTPAATGTPNTL